MAKTRIPVSLEAAQAERIRKAATEGGQKVSAFMVFSALAEAARRERIAASFATLDMAIAATEAEAGAMTWPTEAEAPPEEAEHIRATIAAARARAAAMRPVDLPCEPGSPPCPDVVALATDDPGG